MMKIVKRQSLAQVAVLGAGAFGTALAIQLSSHQPVYLWGRDTDYMENLQKTRVNHRYLPRIVLPENIYCTAQLKEVMEAACDILIALPSHALAEIMQNIKPFFSKKTNLLLATKGLSPCSSELLSTWLDRLKVSYALLAGPSFAKEVAQKLPVSLVIAAPDVSYAKLWKEYFSQPNCHVSLTEDVTGVALGGAMKNVIALAVGISEGLKLGENTGVLLIMQGLSEMKQLFKVLGANQETLMSPAGLGDLLLTCTSLQSRNRQLGVLIGQGFSLMEAKKQLKALSEGVMSAGAIHELAKNHGLTLPLSKMVYTILLNEVHPYKAILSLINQIRSHVSS